MSRCRQQRLYARGKRGYDTSPVERNLKEKRGSKRHSFVVVDEVWWWHVCFHACTGMPPRTPSCRHVGVPNLRPSLCRIALRGNGVEHALVRDVAAAVDGFPPHVPLLLEVVVGADGGENGGAAFQLSSRHNGGGEREAGGYAIIKRDCWSCFRSVLSAAAVGMEAGWTNRLVVVG